MMDAWVDRFVREAVPKIVREFDPSRIILFGSRAKGKAKEASDIDVIVVSDRFKDVPFVKRMPMLLRLVRFEKHIDFLCYTEDEFRKAVRSSAILRTALKDAISVYARSGTSSEGVEVGS